MNTGSESRCSWWTEGSPLQYGWVQAFVPGTDGAGYAIVLKENGTVALVEATKIRHVGLQLEARKKAGAPA
jgi:hypothetical protein